MAKSVLPTVAATDLVRMRHATARSCTHAGRQYEADPEGSMLVPAEAVEELTAHGFTVAGPGPDPTSFVGVKD